mmetsp:Transcript_5727/g.13881  ORF Transcript_5727/g.13881 Transcript_5727/m.13881 type:complete len:289 (-) Transcript_5727:220-1086(-)
MSISSASPPMSVLRNKTKATQPSTQSITTLPRILFLRLVYPHPVLDLSGSFFNCNRGLLWVGSSDFISCNPVAFDNDPVAARFNEVLLPTAEEAQGVEGHLKLWRCPDETRRHWLQRPLPLELYRLQSLLFHIVNDGIVPPPLGLDVPKIVKLPLPLLVVNLKPRVHPHDLLVTNLPNKHVLEPTRVIPHFPTVQLEPQVEERPLELRARLDDPLLRQVREEVAHGPRGEALVKERVHLRPLLGGHRLRLPRLGNVVVQQRHEALVCLSFKHFSIHPLEQGPRGVVPL